MSNQTWGIKESYFSGQGVVLVARRGADGQPLGFRPVGNVPDLKISVATSVTEHKESTTGQRGTDLRLTTETKCSLSFTLENFQAQNLGDALRGDFIEVGSGTTVDKPIKGYAGMISALGRLRVSNVVVENGATALVPYTDETTPWDYQLNSEAGSIRLNDGAVIASDSLGETITAVAVGTTTTLSIAGSTATAGDKITPRGLTGADASSLNGRKLTVVSNNGTAVVVSANTTGKVITATGTPIAYSSGAINLTASFDYVDQVQVDALTQGAPELFMRFEGLNTVDENSPVVVEVFRFLTDPLKELSLISDTTQQFVLDGSVLADTSRPTGSKYFSTQKIG